jgi:small subunit ribosomal protein S20
MANSKQALKRARQSETRTERNRTLRSRMRTAVKNAEQTIESADKKAVPVAFQKAMSELNKAVTKGIIKKGTASRKISRLAAKIRSLAA